MKIFFLIRSLEPGGAERQLVSLAAGLAARGHETHLAVFYGGGALEPEAAGAGVLLHDLGKRGRWDLIGFARRLAGLLRRLRPDVRCSFLGTADLALALLRPVAPRAPLVWNVRAADPVPGAPAAQRLHLRLERLAARLPERIVYNSRAGRRCAEARGFPAASGVVVPNGIDTARFAPDPAARDRVRAEWDVPEGVPLVGLPARLDPAKDHETFLRAAAALLRVRPEAHFVCIGSGPEPFARGLRALADRLGLRDRVRWTGLRADMPAVYAALDLVCLSSVSEGFPNALGEAMACGRPCATTDAGDCAEVLGGLGPTVPPRAPEALAGAMAAGLTRAEREGEPLRRALRERIRNRYDIGRMVNDTEKLLRELVTPFH